MYLFIMLILEIKHDIYSWVNGVVTLSFKLPNSKSDIVDYQPWKTEQEPSIYSEPTATKVVLFQK